MQFLFDSTFYCIFNKEGAAICRTISFSLDYSAANTKLPPLLFMKLILDCLADVWRRKLFCVPSDKLLCLLQTEKKVFCVVMKLSLFPSIHKVTTEGLSIFDEFSLCNTTRSRDKSKIDRDWLQFIIIQFLALQRKIEQRESKRQRSVWRWWIIPLIKFNNARCIPN